MALSLNLAPPYLSRLSLPSSNCPSNNFSTHSPTYNNSLFLLFLSKYTSHVSRFRNFKAHASFAEKGGSNMLSDELLSRISSAKEADEALVMIAEKVESNEGVVSSEDCCLIIKGAFESNNAELALSVYSAMRMSFFDQGLSENGSFVRRWKWARPDVRIYAGLVRGLASSLQVSDAIRIIYDVCHSGVSLREEVSFGKVVRCPSCMIAVAVAQPQHGTQIASCSKCRYQYELVSGNIVTIESEEIRISSCRTQHGYSGMGKRTEALERNEAEHSCSSSLYCGICFLGELEFPVHAGFPNVQTPRGTARTHRFATKTVELPAQEGERVTISVAAPSNIYREVGPFRFSSKAPGFKAGEAMCLTNHINGRETQLLRAPVKNENLSLRNPSFLFPVIALLTTGDFASGIIDPSLPQFISIAAIASVALGTTINSVILPQLNRLPQRMVEVVAIKQQLLSQYDLLQIRINDLREAAEKEVWMLARMCQLENKILAVGEPSYRARRSRLVKVRESLENSLMGRIELIDSYARISSMIEIELEMDSDVLAAESESIAEQIEQIMELENLEERWRIQAEANDEVERLLSSQPMPTEPV
ncbi:hypothetical protein IFM89_029849 [Coptis chinensis]|uniref:Pentatricopeptide repeat-containing protein n=1 Tax=Coptis chinensis TaxID=261450 RepID=A0A835HN77_9MAGN|nr:hypothetical protein IFM89_029849 [Coptis chinensis]